MREPAVNRLNVPAGFVLQDRPETYYLYVARR